MVDTLRQRCGTFEEVRQAVLDSDAGSWVTALVARFAHGGPG